MSETVPESQPTTSALAYPKTKKKSNQFTAMGMDDLKEQGLLVSPDDDF